MMPVSGTYEVNMYFQLLRNNKGSRILRMYPISMGKPQRCWSCATMLYRACTIIWMASDINYGRVRGEGGGCWETSQRNALSA